MTSFSIAIPTLNRASVIQDLLESILHQTVFPKEVIVVDDSKNRETEDVVNRVAKSFSRRNIKIEYVRGNGNGITDARNMGIAHSTGDIHCSLDDDIILDKNYIKEILKMFEVYPDALGVAGHVANHSFSSSSNAVNKVFPFYLREKDKCRVLPAGVTYPYILTKIINCEWLSGVNCCYRRAVLKEFKWDEKLTKYSLCDDVDISYRIQQKYPNSLFMTPYAKIIHHHSPIGRMDVEGRIHREVSYHTYFFFKNIEKTPLNTVNFIYDIFFGRVVTSVLSRDGPASVFTVKAEFNLIRHLKEIEKGVFTSFEN